MELHDLGLMIKTIIREMQKAGIPAHVTGPYDTEDPNLVIVHGSVQKDDWSADLYLRPDGMLHVDGFWNRIFAKQSYATQEWNHEDAEHFLHQFRNGKTPDIPQLSEGENVAIEPTRSIKFPKVGSIRTITIDCIGKANGNLLGITTDENLEFWEFEVSREDLQSTIFKDRYTSNRLTVQFSRHPHLERSKEGWPLFSGVTYFDLPVDYCIASRVTLSPYDPYENEKRLSENRAAVKRHSRNSKVCINTLIYDYVLLSVDHETPGFSGDWIIDKVDQYDEEVVWIRVDVHQGEEHRSVLIHPRGHITWMEIQTNPPILSGISVGVFAMPDQFGTRPTEALAMANIYRCDIEELNRLGSENRRSLGFE